MEDVEILLLIALVAVGFPTVRCRIHVLASAGRFAYRTRATDPRQG